MERQAEPSILDYARFHGIASNYLASDPLDNIHSISRDLATATLADPIGAAGLDFVAIANQAREQVKEKLEVGRDGAIFLSSILKPSRLGEEAQTKLSDWDAVCFPDLNHHHRIRDMKQEPPMLMTDHEVDMRLFAEDRRLEPVDLSKLDLLREDLNEENDEGLEWPGYFWDLPGQLWDRVRAEKIDCTREVLLFIQEVRNGDDGASSGDEAMDGMYDELFEEFRRIKVCWCPFFALSAVPLTCLMVGEEENGDGTINPAAYASGAGSCSIRTVVTCKARNVFGTRDSGPRTRGIRTHDP
jgi:hypothetical protein